MKMKNLSTTDGALLFVFLATAGLVGIAVAARALSGMAEAFFHFDLSFLQAFVAIGVARMLTRVDVSQSELNEVAEMPVVTAISKAIGSIFGRALTWWAFYGVASLVASW